MFKDCAEYLKNLQPMEELNFCDDIVLECPTEEKKINTDLCILNFITNDKERKYSVKTSLSDSNPINYDLHMINKYDENFNSSLSLFQNLTWKKKRKIKMIIHLILLLMMIVASKLLR